LVVVLLPDGLLPPSVPDLPPPSLSDDMLPLCISVLFETYVKTQSSA
jgi:hypothetical protein